MQSRCLPPHSRCGHAVNCRNDEPRWLAHPKEARAWTPQQNLNHPSLDPFMLRIIIHMPIQYGQSQYQPAAFICGLVFKSLHEPVLIKEPRILNSDPLGFKNQVLHVYRTTCYPTRNPSPYIIIISITEHNRKNLLNS
jgi:hypothetical protein